MDTIVRYLIIYDHEQGELVQTPQSFIGPEEATAAFDAYDQAEMDYSSRRDRYEVLLVGSDSLETVKTTHGRFFRRPTDDLEYLTAAG